jgi:hypothetical protein
VGGAVCSGVHLISCYPPRLVLSDIDIYYYEYHEYNIYLARTGAIRGAIRDIAPYDPGGYPLPVWIPPPPLRRGGGLFPVAGKTRIRVQYSAFRVLEKPPRNRVYH